MKKIVSILLIFSVIIALCLNVSQHLYMMLVHLPKQVIFQLLTVKRPAKVVTAKVTVILQV